MGRLRLACANAAGSLAGGLSSALRRGRGEALHGRVLLALYPAALAHLSVGRDIVLVSGTNGKTTTTAFLAARLAAVSGEGVSTSRSGANMPGGIAAALAAAPRHRLAVLECDEMYLPRMLRELQPRAVVLLNLSRDQLHRTGEVRKVAGLWHEALTDCPATVVIDRDDPFLEYAVSRARTVLRVGFGGRRHPDAAVCPACGDLLDWTVGDYRCPCGLGTTPVDVVAARALSGPQRNAVLALATIGTLGYQVPADQAGDAVAHAPDRVTDLTLAGRQVPIRLAKNPESWRSALAAVTAPSVVLAVNARGIDGRDTSWLWDIDFSALRGRQVVCTGDRRADIAYRLHVHGVAVEVQPTVAAAVATLPDPVAVIASYTAFQDLVAAAEGRRTGVGGRP